MKTKMTKGKKIIAGLLALSLIGFLIFLASGFVGNPLSKILVNSSAKRYADKTYEGLDLDLDKAFYNFKDGNYRVGARSETSRDTHFNMDFDGSGKLVYDSYEDDVASGWNTWERINKEYEDLVMELLEDEFPNIDKSSYAIFIDIDDDHRDLELDREYDIRKLGQTRGKLVLYVEKEDPDKEYMADLLVGLREEFDRKDVPFYLIDLSFIVPASEEMEIEEDRIMDFNYSDIYGEGLEKRLEENIKATRDHDEEMDIEKQDEIEEFEEKEEN